MVGITFHDFTFEASAASGQQTSRTFSREVSPCDTSSSSPPSQAPTLEVEISSTSPLASQPSESKGPYDDISSSYVYYSLPNTPAASNDDSHLAVDDELKEELERRPKSALGSPVAPSNHPPQICRRLQRQMNTQLLLTQSQLNAIGALVEEMASSQRQSEMQTSPPSAQSQPSESAEPSTSTQTTTPAASTAPSSSRTTLYPAFLPPSISDNLAVGAPLEIDEGFHEGDTDELNMESVLQNFRRAQDRPGSRIYGYAATTVVYSRPRMRKKISRRKRAEEII